MPFAEFTEKHRIWIEESSRVFGLNLDICALDVLVFADNQEVILELNDSSALGLIVMLHRSLRYIIFRFYFSLSSCFDF